MNRYTGGCQCGAVAHTVAADFNKGIRCNCLHCKRKGFLIAFAQDSDFTLPRGADTETTYHFNKHHIDHTFCSTCGVQAYGHGHDGNDNYMIMINLNCLENFDLSSVTVAEYDGAIRYFKVSSIQQKKPSLGLFI